MRIPVVALVCFLTAGVGAFEPVPVPAGGTPLAEGSALKAYADPRQGSARPAAEGGWRMEISNPEPERGYLAQISTELPGALAKDEIVLALVKARAISGPAAVEAKLQMADPPYTALAAVVHLQPGPDWKEIPVRFQVTAPVESGKAALALLCGATRQTLEVASMRVYRYPAGTDTASFPRIRKTYAGREPDAPWRKAALERIEKLRKADFEVQLRGPDGKPLANRSLRLTLRRHEFGFGAAVTAELLTAGTEDARRYRGIVEGLFSQVVFENDLKDFGWEPGAEGKEERKRKLDEALTWLESRGISVRGHYLMQTAVPPNLSETDAGKIREHFIGTSLERIAFAEGRVCEWDVINHPVAWSGADLLTRRPGLEELDREILKLARSKTSLPLLVNEDQIFRPGKQSDGTFDYLSALARDGLKIDGLGNQAHLDESFLPSPEELLAMTDRFATVVPRQVITEFDVVTQDDEELAADYTRDALIACFSHPSYSGFLLWGFWEGRHWKPEAASWNLDWSIRKRGQVLEEWLGKRWTTVATLTTDENGIARWRGFPGRYEAVIGGNDRVLPLQVTRSNPTAVLKAP